jgi:FkbM family methyltransferase
VSRTLAAFIHAVARVAASGQSPRRRAMTYARAIQRLDGDAAHVVRTRRGSLKTLPLRGPHLAAAAVGFEEEEPETLSWIDSFSASEVFYDVGAATGLLSMYAALSPGVQVYAFEPKATSLGVLVEHLALNGLGEQVFPVAVALAERTQATRLRLASLAPGSGGNSVGGAPDQFGLTQGDFSQGALCYALDELIETFALPAPTQLKIDVDGVEGLILRGAARTLRGVRSVMIEVEGENARYAKERIEPPLLEAGLEEDESVRTSGSGRNRLYRRPKGA